MRVFRNPEFNRLLLICVLVTALLSGAGAALGPTNALFALAVCAVVSLAALILYARHLGRIAGLTAYVERVLRGDTPLQISRNREGEYAIFENELYKLSSALRTQLEKADGDKRLLAEALADISHQIKTPLTAMGIVCQLLRAESLPPREQQRLLRDMDAQLRRVEQLVGLLLKMSRMDAGTVEFREETPGADALLGRALSPLLIPLELRDIRLIRRGKESDRCPCDPAWTAEALGNVIKNCMEHTPPGGAITLSHEETPLRAVITLENSGPPIPEEDLPHVFERFYRGAHAKEGGAGIGLAFARQVIARQNGALTAQNTPAGPRFTAVFHKRTV